MSTSPSFIVIGAGVAGATTAALLAQLGAHVHVVDRRPLKPMAAMQHRVVALGAGSRRIFDHLGLWDQLKTDEVACYDLMHVEAKGQALDFRADAHALDHLGYIVAIGALEAVLYTHLNDHPNITVHAPAQWLIPEFTDQSVKLSLIDAEGDVTTTLSGEVLIGADGARSKVRQALGIRQQLWDYNQSALVGPVVTQYPNPGMAWQRFTELGPLALLPLSDGRSSIVWSVPRTYADKASDWSEAQWVTAINEGLGEPAPDPMGEIQAIEAPQCWPLRRHRAEVMQQGRAVLVGDAAHGVHPLAGQGLNIGLQDAAALAQCLAKPIESQKAKDLDHALAHYGRWRLSASTLSAMGIHMISELHHAPMGLGQHALGAAFFTAQKIWPLRDRLMAKAQGIDGDAPLICQQQPSSH